MILVDSNILLDILTINSEWYKWSANSLASLAEEHELIINDIIYTEVSIGFTKIEELESALGTFFKLVPIPREALFLAGKIFLQYKANKGIKNFILSDFFIGAHACVLGISLMTRDKGYYKTYFPTIKLISP